MKDKSNATPASGILVDRIIATSRNRLSNVNDCVCEPVVSPTDVITDIPVLRPKAVNAKSDEPNIQHVTSYAVNPTREAGEALLSPRLVNNMVTTPPGRDD